MSDTINIDPAIAAAAVDQLAASVGLPVLLAYSPDQAAELAARLEFDAKPGTVAEFVRKGYLKATDPAALTPQEVYQFIGGLDRRRRWKAAPSQHDLKKSNIRLHVEQGQAAGLAPFHDLAAHSIEDLLLQLTESDERWFREVVHEALKLKLQGFEE